LSASAESACQDAVDHVDITQKCDSPKYGRRATFPKVKAKRLKDRAIISLRQQV
jgi:hypothetical protein